MSLKPTNKPLTVKEFEKELTGVCFGCGCHCGYIVYIKDNNIVDLYGHPHDPNSIGSLCTKGMTYVQEIYSNPLRIRKPILNTGNDVKEVSLKEAVDWVRENIKGKVAVFLDRLTDLKDYVYASVFTENLFTDSVVVSFNPSTLRPQEWRDQKIIISIDADPVFSEVMSTRWIVDAFEKSSYIVSVSPRFATVSSKASVKLLLNPYKTVKFLEDLLKAVKGQEVNGEFKDLISKLARALKIIRESLILIGEDILRTEYKGFILRLLKDMREVLKINYSLVGNISFLHHFEIDELIKRIEEFDSFIFVGNPAIYFDDEVLEYIKSKKSVSLSLFPNITANHSSLIIPLKNFPEREFIGFRNGFGLISYSERTLEPLENSLSLWELIERAFGVKGNIEEKLDETGISLEALKNSEGGLKVNIPFIEDSEFKNFSPPEERDLYIYFGNTLVEDTGHWNVWTHDIEKEQFVYMNEKTARKIGTAETVNINGIELRIKINNNIADDVIFVPRGFEEYQPFNPGVRVGKLRIV